MTTLASTTLHLVNRHTGEVLDIRRGVRDGVPVLELRGTLPPNQDGPLLHVHHLEDEEGRVTAGVLSAERGGERFEVEAGQSLRLPRGIPHRWWNAGSAPLVFEGIVTPPVDLDRYLQAIFEVLNAGPKGRPPLIYLAHAALRHRQTQKVLAMPDPLQAVVFRLAVLWGTVLGRYRGTQWPGCPARCGGVAENAVAWGR